MESNMWISGSFCLWQITSNTTFCIDNCIEIYQITLKFMELVWGILNPKIAKNLINTAFLPHLTGFSSWASWIRTNEMQESKSCALPLGDSPKNSAGDRTWTCTVARQLLRLVRLPFRHTRWLLLPDSYSKYLCLTALPLYRLFGGKTFIVKKNSRRNYKVDKGIRTLGLQSHNLAR